MLLDRMQAQLNQSRRVYFFCRMAAGKDYSLWWGERKAIFRRRSCLFPTGEDGLALEGLQGDVAENQVEQQDDDGDQQDDRAVDDE